MNEGGELRKWEKEGMERQWWWRRKMWRRRAVNEGDTQDGEQEGMGR